MNWWIVVFYHKQRHCSYGALRSNGETAKAAVEAVRNCGSYPAAEYTAEAFGPFESFPERRAVEMESEE